MASKRKTQSVSYHTKKQLRARVPAETFEQADLLAGRRGVDRSKLIEDLIFEEILRESVSVLRKSN